MGVPLFQETSIYTLYTEHIIATYMHTIGIKKGLEIWMVDLGRSKKTSLKIELLMDPWKSAASPVLPLDISWLNPQQAAFKGQMIHTVYYVLNRRKWFEVTAQGKADPTSFSIPWPFSMNDLVFKRCAEFLPFLHVNLIYFVFLCEPTSFCS